MAEQMDGQTPTERALWEINLAIRSATDDDPENLARAALHALLALDVDLRMEAMGMVAYGTVDWDDDEERDVLVPPEDVDVLPGAPVFVDGRFVSA